MRHGGCSPSGVSTIGSNDLTDHEASTGTAKPEHGRRDFLRCSHPAERYVVDNRLHTLRMVRHCFRNHRRVRGARTDCVDADALARITVSVVQWMESLLMI